MKPILTTLSYSAGTQSQCILEMVLRGDIEKPDHFLVLNADPGMEDQRSYEFVRNTFSRCREVGIDCITAQGRNLFEDLTHFREHSFTHLDNPPYWTRNRTTGKVGRLKQKCTKFYKVSPMRRELRRYLNVHFGVSLVTKRLPQIESWIGFSADEQDRINNCKSDVKFISIRFPLSELGMTKLKVEGYYLKNGIEKPPRSVCAACFANGLAYFEDMYYNRPDDWDKAVAVDEAIRDMRQLGVEDECFVSSTLIPLMDLPAMNFKKSDEDYTEHRCNSGVCFV